MADSNDKAMTWQARETMLALQRLTTARAHLAALEEQAGGAAQVAAAIDPDDAVRVDKLHEEIERLRPKLSSRFGAGAARDKIEELEFQQRLVLDRMGFATYDAYQAAREVPAAQTAAAASTVAVDATMLEFARRECSDAEAAFLEIASMVIPEAEVDPDQADDDEEHDAQIIDLPAKPSAAG